MDQSRRFAQARVLSHGNVHEAVILFWFIRSCRSFPVADARFTELLILILNRLQQEAQCLIILDLLLLTATISSILPPPCPLARTNSMAKRR